MKLEDIPIREDPPFWKHAVGSKAFFLAELLQAGIPVPGAIVLRSCPREQDWAAVLEWWHQEGCPAVAVRSSAADEDSDTLSFAGQFRTYLDIRTADALRASVAKCFESIRNRSSAAYRGHFVDSGLPTGDQRDAMHVVIQRMVVARVAGVYFTVDPMDPTAGWLIEWVEGGGENLVSGRQTPGRIHADADDRSGIMRLLLPFVERVERLLPFPVDIEWAIDRDGAPWILQARPITAHASGASRGRSIDREISRLKKRNARGTYWDGQAFAEWPGVPTTLAVSIWTRAFSGGSALGGALRALGYPESRQAAPATVLDSMFGRPYVNSRRMDKLLFGDTMMVTERTPHPQVHFRLQRVSFRRMANLPAALLGTARAAYNLSAFRSGWIRACREAYERAAACEALPNDPSVYRSLALPDLISAYAPAVRDFSDRQLVWPLTLILLIESATEGLRRVITKCTPADQVDARLQRHLSRASSAATFGPDRQYEGVCADAVSRPAFLSRFGHRGPGELELSRPRWVELGERAFIVPGRSAVPPADQKRSPDVDEIAIPLFYRSFYDKESVHVREMLALREEWKDLIMRSYAHLRWMALEVGRRTGLGDLIFDLRFGELPMLTRGPAAGARLHRLAALRARRRQAFDAVRLPAIVGLDDMDAIATGVPASAEVGPSRMQGHALAPGLVVGEVRVVTHPEDVSTADWPDDTILVAEAIDPGWTPLFGRVKGLVIEKGGVLSHCAIVAREMGVPAVGGILGCCDRLRDGQRIWVDGNHGHVLSA